MMNAGIELVRNNTEKVQTIERVMLFAPFMLCDYNSLVQVQGAMIAGRVVGLVNRLCTDSGNSLGFRVQELNRELDSLRGGAVAAAAQARVDRETLSSAGGDDALLNEEDVDPNNSQQPSHHQPSSFYKTIATLDPTAKAIIATHQRTIAADVALQLLDVVDVFVELVVRNPPQALSGLLTKMFAFILGSSSMTGAPSWLLEQRARTCAGWGVVLGIAAFRSCLGLYINRQEMRSVSASAGAHLRMLYRHLWKSLRGSRRRRNSTGRIEGAASAAVAEGEREEPGSLPSSVTRPSTETGALVVNRVASPGLVIPTVRIPPRSSLSVRHGSRSVRQPSAALAADEDYRSSSVLGRQRRELESGPALAHEEANGSPSPLRPLQDRLPALPPSASPAPRALTTSKPPTATTTSSHHHHHHNRVEDLGLPPNVHLRTFTEYIAFLLDIMGIVTPMLWAGIAYLYRPAGLLGVGVSAKEASARTTTTTHNTVASRRSGGAGSSSSWGSWLGGLTRGVLPSSSRRSVSSSDDGPRVRNFGPSPALAGSTQQSWGAWRVMLVLNVVRLVVALLVRMMRRPTVVVQIGSSSSNHHHTTLHQHSPHHIADLARAGSALRTIGNHCLKDPYFSVVIRSFIEEYIVGGRLSRIPLVGPIIQAQVGMNLSLQRNSFTFTNK